MAKMMRLTYYAAASAVAATGVVLKAFHDRPNFYSATVQLSQSPISYGILLNFLLLSFGTLVYAIQLLLFGSLRLIERERLYERSWISITETLLIMMTFRDDISFHFLFLLSNLIVVRMWSWLNEGRIEMLEQQPPSNPRLFHARLSASLAMTIMLDAAFLKHCVDTVLNDARPGMMVMYAFEFAVLGISCISAMLRYFLALYEMRVVSIQTKGLLDTRRRQVQQELDAARTLAREAGEDEDDAIRSLARPEDVDENEIEAAGWEAKGQWVFVLDISTDFLRLVVYLAFFTLLLLFHGLPIHILRDVYITLHSFLKRIHSYIQYRNATKDMNAKFPDATSEELANEDTCIVCREDMRVWTELDEHGNQNDQRLRPKKLPCGHILHFNCLRSWLERQQVCPTCRRSVLASPPDNSSSRRNANQAQQRQQPQPMPDNQQHDLPRQGNEGNNALPDLHENLVLNGLNRAQGNQDQVPDHNANQGQEPQPRRRHQVDFTIPFLGHRIVFDWGHVDAETLRRIQLGPRSTRNATTSAAEVNQSNSNAAVSRIPTQADLIAYERAISREIMLLNLNQAQLAQLRAMQQNLSALRQQVARAQFQWEAPLTNNQNSLSPSTITTTDATSSNAISQARSSLASSSLSLEATATNAGAMSSTAPMSNASANLPQGMVLPEGWTLVPLTQVPAQPTSSPENEPPISIPPVTQPPLPLFQNPAAFHPVPVPYPPFYFGPPNLPAQQPHNATSPHIPSHGHVDRPSGANSSETRPPSGRLQTLSSTSNFSPQRNVTADIGDAESPNVTQERVTDIGQRDDSGNGVPTWSFNGISNGHNMTPGHGGRAPHRQPAPSPGAMNSDTTSSATEDPSSLRSTVNKGKGKARAVTVEDDPDEEPVD